MDTIFRTIVDLSGMASIVILVVLAARLCLRKAPKIFSYALWSIVLLRLLIPFSIPSPVSAVPEIQITEEIQIDTVLPQIEFETPADRQQNLQNLENSVQQNVTYVPQKTTLTPVQYLGLLWLTGVAGMGLYSILSYVRIRKQIAISIPLRNNIYLADDIKSPFVIGLIRPKIYLSGNLGEAEQEYIILHEQHHIRRFDHWIKALAFLALTLHWFNPLVWVAFVLSAKDMEMSCDEAVIRKAGENIRGAYSASLLTLATGKRIIAGTPLAFGEGDTKGRIRNLANWKRPAFWVILLAIILCIILAVCLLTNQTGNSGGNEGGTWYYGTVTDRAMAKVNESDWEGRPYITILCDDGEERQFWLGKYTDDPGDVLGMYVMIYSVIESGTELRIARSIQTTTPLIRENLEEAVYYAMLTHHRGKYLGGQCQTAHFKQLSYEETGMTTESGEKFVDEITLYGIVMYEEFNLTDGILEDTSGACCPTVLTFAVSEDGKLTLKEYWEPRDGELYPKDIKAKFKGKPWPDTQSYLAEQQLSNYLQAMEHFDVEVDVVIHSILSDMVKFSQWHPYFGDMIEACKTQRTMLKALGTDTLKYCFQKFMDGGNEMLYGQLMSYVCSEIMESMGENSIENWSFQQSGQDWFRAIKYQARELVESGADLKISHPGTYLLISMDESILYDPDWGLTITGENVTPTSTTLIVTQSGIKPDGELITGQPFFLDRLEDGEWVPMEPLLEAWSWTMEGWMIPVNDTVRWDVNWDWLYGTLEAGQYRFGKNISCVSEPGDYEEAVYYVEFEIQN